MDYFQGKVQVSLSTEASFLPQISTGVMDSARQELLAELATVVTLSRSADSPFRERPLIIPPEFLMQGRDHARVMTQLEVWLEEERADFERSLYNAQKLAEQWRQQVSPLKQPESSKHADAAKSKLAEEALERDRKARERELEQEWLSRKATLEAEERRKQLDLDKAKLTKSREEFMVQTTQTTARRASTVKTPRLLKMEAELEQERAERKALENKLQAQLEVGQADSVEKKNLLTELQLQLDRERKAREALEQELAFEQSKQNQQSMEFESEAALLEKERERQLQIERDAREAAERALKVEQDRLRLERAAEEAHRAELQAKLKDELESRLKAEKEETLKRLEEAQRALAAQKAEMQRREAEFQASLARRDSKTPRTLKLQQDLEAERRVRAELTEALAREQEKRQQLLQQPPSKDPAVELLLLELQEELQREKEARETLEEELSGLQQVGLPGLQSISDARRRSEVKQVRHLLEAARKVEETQQQEKDVSGPGDFLLAEQKRQMDALESQLKEERDQRESLQRQLLELDQSQAQVERRVSFQGADEAAKEQARALLVKARLRETDDRLRSARKAAETVMSEEERKKLEDLQRQLESERTLREELQRELDSLKTRPQPSARRRRSSVALLQAEQLQERENARRMLFEARQRAEQLKENERLAADAESRFTSQAGEFLARRESLVTKSDARLRDLEQQFEAEKEMRRLLEEALKREQDSEAERGAMESDQRARAEALEEQAQTLQRKAAELEAELENQRKARAQLEDALKAASADQGDTQTELQKIQEQLEKERAARAELEGALSAEQARAAELASSHSLEASKLIEISKALEDERRSRANDADQRAHAESLLHQARQGVEKTRAQDLLEGAIEREKTRPPSPDPRLQQLQDDLDNERKVRNALERGLESARGGRELAQKLIQEVEQTSKAGLQQTKHATQVELFMVQQELARARIEKQLAEAMLALQEKRTDELLKVKLKEAQKLLHDAEALHQRIADETRLRKLAEEATRKEEEKVKQMEEDRAAEEERRAATNDAEALKAFEEKIRQQVLREIREREANRQLVLAVRQLEKGESESRAKLEQRQDEARQRLKEDATRERQALAEGSPTKKSRVRREVDDLRRREEALRQLELTKAQRAIDTRKRVDEARRRLLEERDRLISEYDRLRFSEESRVQAEINNRLQRERRRLELPASSEYNDKLKTLSWEQDREYSVRMTSADRRRWVLEQARLQAALLDAEYQREREVLSLSLLPRGMPSPSKGFASPARAQEPSQEELGAPSPSAIIAQEAWASFSQVPITLGRLVHLKTSFDRCDTTKRGKLDLFELGNWVQSMGIPDISFDKLRKMLKQVDVENSGFVQFWAFLAIQVYVTMAPELARSMNFQDWIRYCTQSAPPLPPGTSSGRAAASFPPHSPNTWPFGTGSIRPPTTDSRLMLTSI